LEFSAPPRGTPTNTGRTVEIQNDGPVVVGLNRSVVTVRSAHLTGRSTDIKLGGTAALAGKRELDLQLNANTDLSLLQDLDRDVYSSGNVALNAVVHGQASKPLVNGKVELKDASINVTQSPNGISKANGVILLNGTNATVQNLTGESGGGKITVAGFGGLTGTTLRYALRTKAEHVRTRYAGASIVSSAALTLNGTTEHSVLSGNVTIERLGFNSQSDFGSMLSSSATPPETPSAPAGPLAGMRLDIRVRTAPDVRFQTSIAQSLQGIADLTVQGTLANPGLTGRVNITEGRLVFFGNQYDVNRGSVSFYNPLKIAPVLDVDLETTVKGVDVILGVSGPIENMKLSYRSDPPLRFDEIVALLATGKVPASDPTIAAHQEVQPQQSLTQMGESAIVSQAVAAPLANRIQRVFGVNQIKIDPTFTSGSALPQARITLQQQISGNIVFTYTTDLTQTNSQILRVEWAVSPRVSAIATRDENGLFGVDFYIKRQFR
jgi:translocation and assembly module TamB